MKSSNGNIFRVTGSLCGEFTGPGELPTQRAVTRSFDVFFDLRLNKRLSKQPWGWWFETPSWSLWRQFNVSSDRLPLTYTHLHGAVFLPYLVPHKGIDKQLQLHKSRQCNYSSKPKRQRRHRCVDLYASLDYVPMISYDIYPGPRFNIKMPSYQNRKYHCGEKTILRPSYLHNGISYTGKMTSLYWIGAQDVITDKLSNQKEAPVTI